MPIIYEYLYYEIMEWKIIMNLYQQIIELYRDEKEWNYYSSNMHNLKDMDKLFSGEWAKDFIKKYFECGEKQGVIWPCIDEMECMRSMHTISVFFLGILIQEKLAPNLEIVSQYIENYKFSYIWFLVCLYHDLGYVVEKDWSYKYKYIQKSNEYLRKYNCMDRIREQYAFKELGLVYVPRFGYVCGITDRNRQSGGIVFTDGNIVCRSTYRLRTVWNYLEYCKMMPNINHYDHGIVGGLWLYDSLYKNYREKYEDERKRNHGIKFRSFIYDDRLHFSTEQITVFAYIADCIIAHNIWPANADMSELYQKYGLEELTYSQFRPITFARNPVLYILAIADTIEPIKIYSGDYQGKEIDIWKGIDITFSTTYLIIKIYDDRLQFNKMVRKVNGLENWISVKIDINKHERKICIYFVDKE